MRKRAQLVDGTRQRITEAAVRLHTTVGPARSSISAIAEEAGVTRLTVYRHFSDLDELFAACVGHWMGHNPPPDPAVWMHIPDLSGRVRRAFVDLYGWYDAHGEELYPIHRDFTTLPLSAQAAMMAQDGRYAEALTEGLDHDDAGGDAIRAVAGHLVAFTTWRSLRIGQGLDQQGAIELAERIFLSVARPSHS